MAEIDKVIEEEMVTPDSEEIDIELEGEEPTTVEEAINETEEFFKNLTEEMSDETLQRMSNQLLDDYKKDRVSRKDWETSYTSNLDLLGIKHTTMTRPFKGSASVTHPLLSEAVTSFQAQAYKELLPSSGPVRTRVLGVEDDGKVNQAQRVQDFMNYMLTEEIEEYTPEFDQLLFYLALAGSAFKKVYYDEVMQRAVSKFIPAEDLVVPYYATDLMDCERITHVIKMGENEILKKQAAGFYRDVELKPTAAGPTEIEKKYQELEGVTPSTDKQYSYQILEMHVDLNLEEFEMQNPDKQVKVPYIVTIDEGSGEVLSIYRNYDMNDETKKRKEYFVHFKFLPGLGFFGFGLTHMIGGLSRTATQALRQLLDAGTLSNLPAGFKQRGVRVRDEASPIQPGEFKDVDAPGGNLRDAFFPLPYKEPSPTLLNLLGVVVQAGQRFASIADMQVGDGNQAAAVGTTVALLERGSRVMSAIHKRCYAAMKNEFRLLSKIVAQYLPPEYPYDVVGGARNIKQTDFDDRVDVVPVADPNIFSMSQRITLAQTQLQIATANPQLHNMYQIYRNMYNAIGVKDVDAVLPPPPPTAPKDPSLEHIDAMGMKPFQAFPGQDHRAHITAHLNFMSVNMVRNNPPVMAAIQKNILEHISIMAQEQVQMEFREQMMQMQQMQQMSAMDPQIQQQLQMLTNQVESRKAVLIAEMTEEFMKEENEITSQFDNDPLLKLKSREVDLRAMENDRKREADKTKEDLERAKLMQSRELAEDKMDQNEELAELRAGVSLAKKNNANIN